MAFQEYKASPVGLINRVIKRKRFHYFNNICNIYVECQPKCVVFKLSDMFFVLRNDCGVGVRDAEGR